MDQNLKDRIRQLKEKRKAIILAHNYQIPEVQEVADLRGDSFALSKAAAETDAEVIVFCGVHFMAESAAILSPDKTVLLPEILAGCPLADTITVEALREKKRQYPGVPVVCYVNSSATVKAESDICCTSANAVKVVESLDSPRVLFVPDRNLGHFVARQTKKEVILWKGVCVTHNRVRVEDVVRARQLHPEAKVVVHPECIPEVVAMADHVAGTGGIIRYVKESPADTFIIGTEMGMIYRLEMEAPGKKFYLLSPGLVCPNMKFTDLEKVVRALEEMKYHITVPADIAGRARLALERMLAVG